MKTLLSFVLLLVALTAHASPGQPYFVRAIPGVAPQPFLIPTNKMAVWIIADSVGHTNIQNGIDGSFPTDGQPIWRTQNYGQSSIGVPSGSASQYPLQYWSCNTATNSGMLWLETAGPSGMATFCLTNGGNHLYVGGCGNIIITNPYTLFAVIRITNTVTSKYFTHIYASDNNDIVTYMDFHNNLGAPPRFWIGKNDAPVAAGPLPTCLTNWTILTIGYNGSNSFIRTNGVNMSNFSCYTVNAGYYSIFDYKFLKTADGFYSYCSELMLTHKTMPDTNEIAQCEAYLKSKWGL